MRVDRRFEFGRNDVVVLVAQLGLVNVAQPYGEDRICLEDQSDPGLIKGGDVVARLRRRVFR